MFKNKLLPAHPRGPVQGDRPTINTLIGRIWRRTQSQAVVSTTTKDDLVVVRPEKLSGSASKAAPASRNSETAPSAAGHQKSRPLFHVVHLTWAQRDRKIFSTMWVAADGVGEGAAIELAQLTMRHVAQLEGVKCRHDEWKGHIPDKTKKRVRPGSFRVWGGLYRSSYWVSDEAQDGSSRIEVKSLQEAMTMDVSKIRGTPGSKFFERTVTASGYVNRKGQMVAKNVS